MAGRAVWAAPSKDKESREVRQTRQKNRPCRSGFTYYAAKNSLPLLIMPDRTAAPGYESLAGVRRIGANGFK
jgi:hypothetical protein